MLGRLFAQKKRQILVNEFTILGVFIAVVFFGLLYGALLAVTGSLSQDVGRGFPAMQPVIAPTMAEYEAEAREVLAPFFTQALQMVPADFSGDTGAMLQLVQKTQDRLLRVRVPKQYQDAHLGFVLLLDQWKRALAGSVPDRDVVLQKTKDQAAANQWLGL